MKDEVCHCLKVRRASNAITKIYDKYLNPSGIGVSQFSVMEHISKLGPVTVSELALQCQLDRTTLVRNLKTLEERGYVSDISNEGARKRQLVLTHLGRERLDHAEVLWSQAQEYIRSSLGESDLKSLTEMMSKIEDICK